MKAFLVVTIFILVLFEANHAQENPRQRGSSKSCPRGTQERIHVEEKCTSQRNSKSLVCKNISVTEELPLQLFCESHKVTQIKILSSSIPVLYAYSFIDFGYLIDLTLNNSKISTINRDAFYGLENLQRLRLKHNHLRRLGSGVLNPLANLTLLKLNNNDLEELCPYCFSNLTNLEDLDVSFNGLMSVSKHVFENLPNLRKLYMDDNFIGHLDVGCFANLPKLVQLYLDHNLLDVIDCHVFDNLRSLEFLDLSYNRLTALSYDCFDNSSVLKELHIDHNAIAYFEIRDFLSHHPYLADISLNHNAWDCDCLSDIIKELEGRSVKIMDSNPENSADNVRGIACRLVGQSKCRAATGNFVEHPDFNLATDTVLFPLSP